MINLCNTLLVRDKKHAIPADFRKTIEPIPVIDRVIEVDVAPMLLKLSTVSSIVFWLLKFFYFFFILWFSSLKYVTFSAKFLIELLKLLT